MNENILSHEGSLWENPSDHNVSFSCRISSNLHNKPITEKTFAALFSSLKMKKWMLQICFLPNIWVIFNHSFVLIHIKNVNSNLKIRHINLSFPSCFHFSPIYGLLKQLCNNLCLHFYLLIFCFPHSSEPDFLHEWYIHKYICIRLTQYEYGMKS